MTPPNWSLAWARALVDELARCGVRRAVVSPGSRSAPLALALAAEPRIETSIWLDERAAAFFALGLARITRRPVALVCTSGTAVANYHPAVIEASHGRVPLLVLSADRPAELRDCGAGQTIEQRALFGGAVRWFVEAPLPEASDRMFAHLRTLACRAVGAATGPAPGPVHVNLPFREPLDPTPDATQQRELARLRPESMHGRVTGPWVTIEPARSAPSLDDADAGLDALAQWMASEERGWICVGPVDLDAPARRAIAQLASASGWPLLADALSQLRSGDHDRSALVDAHDAVLRATSFVEAHLPRRVLRFGAMPTSKAYRLLLERHPEIEQWVVERDAWLDPTAHAARWIRADAGTLATALCARRILAAEPGEFARRWIEAGRVARSALASELEVGARLSEPGAVWTLARHLPASATLFVSSSMPVRDVDSFWPAGERALRVCSNRGANGIDGTLACALGTAAGSAAPCVALLGDLALLHDIGSLRAARDGGCDLTVVVLDNDGGGIFEFLPVAQSAERAVFERWLATPHGVDLEAVLAGFGVPCTRAETPGALRAELERSLATPGVQVIRVPTDRRENRELHAKLFARAAAALAPLERAP